MAVLPRFPKHDMGVMQFAVCALLASGAKTSSRLCAHLLKDMHWEARTRNIVYVSLRRYEIQGVITSFEVNDSERVYQLTRKGFEKWARQFRFYEHAIETWNGALREHTEADFPDIRTRKQREPIVKERSPTPEEAQAILDASTPVFRPLYEASLRTGVRPTDLANSRIENIDWKVPAIILEQTSVTERRIKNRFVPMDDSTVKVVQLAIDDRVAGPIFRGPRRGVWTASGISASFRRARKKAGIAANVVASGRGGHVATVAEEEKEDG